MEKKCIVAGVGLPTHFEFDLKRLHSQSPHLNCFFKCYKNLALQWVLRETEVPQ